MLQRVKEVQESDLRMLGSLARNIQRVIAVTQADIDAAAAQGKAWVVKPVVKVSDPLDNLRGGTQLVIKQNSILPGQNVMRVLYSGSGKTVGPTISPVDLPGAAAEEILSLTAFGGTSQGGFNAMGYTPLDYLESSRTQYIDTGIVGNKNTKIEVKWLYHTTSSAAGSGRVFGSRASSGPNRIAFGTNTGTVATTAFFWQFGSGNAVISTGTDLELDTWYVITASRTIHNINGTDYGSPFSEETITTPQNIKLFGFDNAGTMACGIGRCAYCKIWDGDQIVRYFVPAKNSNGVVGMLDLVNMQFYQNAGTGDFAYGTEYVPTPDNPVALYCNNGEIKPTGNILDSNTSNISVGYYINRTTGEVTQSDANFMFSQYIPIQPSTSYVAYGRRRGDNLLSQYNRITWYDANQNFISTANYTQNTIGKGTSPSNAAYMRLSVNPIGNTDPITIDTVLGFDWYIGKGNTEVPITPYSTIGAYADDAIETIETQDDQNATVSTATCEILLSVGEYTDEQEVISGAITRKVGIKAFDGTESWSRASNQDGSANYVFYTQIDDKKVGNNQPMLCSHHKYIGSGSYVTLTAGKFLSNSANTSVYFDGGSITTATNWKNWLATQYANGTPVIVIYPLATETTETVTGQPMQTAAGNNTAEITQAGMAGLELEVEYIKQ